MNVDIEHKLALRASERCRKDGTQVSVVKCEEQREKVFVNVPLRTTLLSAAPTRQEKPRKGLSLTPLVQIRLQSLLLMEKEQPQRPEHAPLWLL